MSDPKTAKEVEDATATFRELREYSRGRLDVEHHDVHPVAGLVEDPEVREALIFMAEAFEPFERPDGERVSSFWESQLARRAIRKYATHNATRAISEGNITQASYFSGLPSYDSDVSGLHAINRLAEWLNHSEACKLIYIAALMGRGKTDLALTFLEVVNDHFRRVKRANKEVGADGKVPTPEFAANFHVDVPEEGTEVRQINRYDRLVEWMERGDSSQIRWFIFDEASSELTAQNAANAQKVVERMGGLVKKMRKRGVNMIVIGHDRGDVHVAIRSLADFVDKTGLKSASFYSGIENREPTGHLFDLGGIPPTSWEFDTDDTADWDWCDGSGGVDEPEGWSDDELKHDIEERAAQLWDSFDDLTQTEVAETLSNDEISISATGVSRGAKRLGLTT